jgi:choline dehydrogenase-like flavoprotein
MPEPLTEQQLATLRAVCDTVVPSIPRDPDPHGLWARSATDVGADQALLEAMDQMPPADRDGLLQLLDVLAQQGFAEASQLSREQMFTNLSLASHEAAAGVGGLVALTLFFTYALPDETGRNPNWAAFGYPGPIAAPPQEAKPITPVVPDGDTTLEADVVIVGSGAGGSLIASRLAKAGANVVVLEAGHYRNEADFLQLEIPAFQELFWRGGPTPTADLNIGLQAGACVGGGTIVNYTNCLKTKPWIREEWASEHGLSDLTTEAFDRHLDTVWQELRVTGDCSELNRTQQAMQRGAEALGWSFKTITRNWNAERHDAASAGYLGFGDSSGAKMTALHTYLHDAAAHGARVLPNCFAERVFVEGGRAAGVRARWTSEGLDRSATVTVRAPQVVVAAGGLESPGVLLRSGIGGPAAGDYLRLHPCTAVMGDYGTDMQSWWGAPQAGLVDEFAAADDEHYGFLVESAQYTTGVGASATPFVSAVQHKQAMEDFRNGGTFIGLIRDHGHGRVTLDDEGMAQPWYAIDDPVDVRSSHRALEAQIRIHHAAGARRIQILAQDLPTWRPGDDLEAFVERAKRVPLRAGGAKLFSAHQMGSCRMGADPATSVADPRGELHDVPGVWIGDASAFPTASGTNPMITIYALASRTAEHIAEAAGAATTTTKQEVPA